MKSLILSIGMLAISSFSAHAAQYKYQCVADALEAYNSDIYYNLSQSEIESLVKSGVSVAVDAYERCTLKASTSPKACSGNLEAEFIGEVVNFSHSEADGGNAGYSTFSVSRFTHYQANGTCPLDESFGEKATIRIKSQTSLKNGSPISGYLIYSPETNSYSIEGLK
jgi:hypothetical protein